MSLMRPQKEHSPISYFSSYLVKLGLLHLLLLTSLMIGLATLMTWKTEPQSWKNGQIASRYIIGQAMMNLRAVDDCMLIGTEFDIECEELDDGWGSDKDTRSHGYASLRMDDILEPAIDVYGKAKAVAVGRFNISGG